MDWNFSFGWFITGVIILIAGTCITVFYQKISDSLVSGVSSYEKVKLVGIIVAGIGFLVMANLHTFVLSLLVSLVFKR